MHNFTPANHCAVCQASINVNVNVSQSTPTHGKTPLAEGHVASFPRNICPAHYPHLNLCQRECGLMVELGIQVAVGTVGRNAFSRQHVHTLPRIFSPRARSHAYDNNVQTRAKKYILGGHILCIYLKRACAHFETSSPCPNRRMI